MAGAALADHVHDFHSVDGWLRCSVCFRSPVEAKLSDLTNFLTIFRQDDGEPALAGRRVA